MEELTRKAFLLLYPKALTTTVTTIVFDAMTRISDATRMSICVHKNCTLISIPMLARKRDAKRFRIGSTFKIHASKTTLEYATLEALCERQWLLYYIYTCNPIIAWSTRHTKNVILNVLYQLESSWHFSPPSESGCYSKVPAQACVLQDQWWKSWHLLRRHPALNSAPACR